MLGMRPRRRRRSNLEAAGARGRPGNGNGRPAFAGPAAKPLAVFFEVPARKPPDPEQTSGTYLAHARQPPWVRCRRRLLLVGYRTLADEWDGAEPEAFRKETSGQQLDGAAAHLLAGLGISKHPKLLFVTWERGAVGSSEPAGECSCMGCLPGPRGAFPAASAPPRQPRTHRPPRLAPRAVWPTPRPRHAARRGRPTGRPQGVSLERPRRPRAAAPPRAVASGRHCICC